MKEAIKKEEKSRALYLGIRSLVVDSVRKGKESVLAPRQTEINTNQIKCRLLSREENRSNRGKIIA